MPTLGSLFLKVLSLAHQLVATVDERAHQSPVLRACPSDDGKHEDGQVALFLWLVDEQVDIGAQTFVELDQFGVAHETTHFVDLPAGHGHFADDRLHAQVRCALFVFTTD